MDIRAAQRTFEGAYIRTALGQFSFALVVLKIFTSEFYSIGALFAVYGTGILLASLFRRHEGVSSLNNVVALLVSLIPASGNSQFFSERGDDGLHRRMFKTSGNMVVVLTALSIAAYLTLLALTLRIDDEQST